MADWQSIAKQDGWQRIFAVCLTSGAPSTEAAPL